LGSSAERHQDGEVALPSAASDVAAFDVAADAHDDDPHHAMIVERLVTLLRSRPRTRLVLDVATGTGFAAFAALPPLMPERIVGIDISPGMIGDAAAKAVASDPDGRIEWRVEPAVPLDLVDSTADVVLCASARHVLGAAALRDWRRTPPAAPERPRRSFLVRAEAP
jgi:ubiquinone/menaquinone biosynthesis C-methylase UbiE